MLPPKWRLKQEVGVCWQLHSSARLDGGSFQAPLSKTHSLIKFAAIQQALRTPLVTLFSLCVTLWTVPRPQAFTGGLDLGSWSPPAAVRASLYFSFSLGCKRKCSKINHCIQLTQHTLSLRRRGDDVIQWTRWGVANTSLWLTAADPHHHTATPCFDSDTWNVNVLMKIILILVIILGCDMKKTKSCRRKPVDPVND